MSTMGYVSTLDGAAESASFSLDFERQLYRILEGGKLTPKSYSEVLAITRNTSGGRFNAKGLYESVPANQPRIDYDPLTKVVKGLLLEEQRTNAVLNSGSIDKWPRAQVTIQPRAITAPDGTLTACKVISNTIAQWHMVYTQGFSVTSGTTYVASVFVKAGELTRVRIGFNNNTVITGNNVFDLTTGTRISGTTGTIEAVGDGWFRITHTATAIASSASLSMAINPVKAGETEANTPSDGVSGLYLWGGQVEPNFATSYIPTPVTFSARASAACYFDSRGDLKVAEFNVPRDPSFSFDQNGEIKPQGLLLEESATNLIRRTGELMSAAPWTSSGVTMEESVGLDGGFTATRVIEGSGVTASKEVRQVAAIAVVSGTAYTYSVYAKPSQGSDRQLRIGFGNNGIISGKPAQAVFNLGSRTLASLDNCVHTIQKLPNGWARYSITVEADMASTSAIYLTLLSGGGAGYSGDGVSGCVLYGPQVEVNRDAATSYIKAAGSFTSRATPAAYTDSLGVLRTADVNVARDKAYKYDETGKLRSLGLLLEPAGTNLIIDSVGFEGGNWGRNNISVVPSAVPAPDGVGVFRSITTSGNVGATGSLYRANPPVSTTAITTFSMYVKAGTTDRCQLRFYDTSNAALVTFNLTAGTVESSSGPTYVGSSITPAGGGVYRITLSINYGARPQGGLAAYLYVNFNNPAVGDSIFAWGAQLEVNPFATSYIPTAGTAVTRAADVYASSTSTRAADLYSSSAATRVADYTYNTTLSRWFNQAVGTFCVTGQHLPGADSPNKHVVNLQATAVQDWLGLRHALGIAQVGSANTSGSDTMIMPGMAVPNGAVFKAATRYKNNDGGFSVNGLDVQKDTTCLFPPVVPYARLVLGSYDRGTINMNGWIKSFNYYPTALSDSQLQIIST